MTARELFDGVSRNGSHDLRQVVEVCEAEGGYCLIGGLALNCYLEPMHTLDADFVLALSPSEKVRRSLEALGFQFEGFAHSLNAHAPQSDLRIQFTLDPRYEEFPLRAVRREQFGISLKVACLEDLIQGKTWAMSDPKRRLSKRLKDQTDLVRIGEQYPELRSLLPEEIQVMLREA